MFIHSPSGLYLTLNRAYDPYSGRWLSRDPIGEKGGIDLFEYSYDNPPNIIDPDGTDPIAAVVGAISGAFYGGIGAAATPGHTITSVIVGAAVGFGVGGAVGFFAPPAIEFTPLGVSALATANALAAGAGDFVGQVSTNYFSRKAALSGINVGEIGGVNRPGIPGGSNFQVDWSHDEQDNEQIQP